METSRSVGINASARTQFIRKVYFHLFVACCAFIGLEYLWFHTTVAARVFQLALEINWLVFLGLFMVSSWLASRLANTSKNKTLQYLGFALFVVAESLIFIPLLMIAQYYADGGVIERAGYITAGAFAGLTAIVFVTKVDLSGMRKYLIWAGLMALALIVAGAIFGFELGTFFSVAMVGLAGASILYDTSEILHTQDDESYVAAALQLFASVALMLWYVIRILSSRH